MDSIRVAVRCRPLNGRELKQQQENVWNISGNSISMTTPTGKPLPGSTYSFDNVFNSQIQTSTVYNEVAKDIISSALEGFNGTIFAYGQTSSGKTHTMHGSESEPGIIMMAINDIFAYVEKHSDREFLIRVSFLEIYKEVIGDLIQPGNENLKVHETFNREIFVGNLTEEIVLTPEEVMGILEKGQEYRHVGGTNMNERSSRSHTIFRMVIESRERTEQSTSTSRIRKSLEGGAVRVSSLNLVDLAGSERARHTGAEGSRLAEGGFINKSLLTLRNVIAKLSEGNDNSHVPFRDSKLTRILQPSLGGNARTAIICTVTTASNHTEETLSTLKFASGAKRIKNKPEVNEVISDEALLQRYRKEIEGLKEKLGSLENSRENKEDDETRQKELDDKEYMLLQLRLKDEERISLDQKIKKLAKMILNSSTLVENPRKKIKLDPKANRRRTWFPGMTVKVDDEEEEDQEEPVQRPSKTSLLLDSSAPLSSSPSSSSSTTSLAREERSPTPASERETPVEAPMIPSTPITTQGPQQLPTPAQPQSQLRSNSNLHLRLQLEQQALFQSQLKEKLQKQLEREAEIVEASKTKLRALEEELRVVKTKSALQERIEQDLVKTQEFLEMEVEVTKTIMEEVAGEKEKMAQLTVELQAALSGVESEKKQAEESVTALAAQNEILGTQKTELERTVQELASQVATQGEAGAESVKRLESLTARVAELEAALEKVEAELSQGKEIISQLEAAKAELSDTLGEITGKQSELERQNESLLAAQEQERLKKEQERLELEMAETEALETQDRLYQSLRKDKLILQTQTQQAELKITELTRANIEGKDKIESLERLISQMKSDENTASKKLQRLEKLSEQSAQQPARQEAASESAVVEGLRTEIDNLKAELLVLKKENQTANLIKSNEMTQSRLAKMKLQETSKELDKIKSEREKLLKQLTGVGKTAPASPKAGGPLSSIENKLQSQEGKIPASPSKKAVSVSYTRSKLNEVGGLGESEGPTECAQQ